MWVIQFLKHIFANFSFERREVRYLFNPVIKVIQITQIYHFRYFYATSHLQFLICDIQ
jgi:hypothetical protein